MLQITNTSGVPASDVPTVALLLKLAVDGGSLVLGPTQCFGQVVVTTST